MNTELAVAQKYGLFWAGSIMEDKVSGLIADGLYIYQPERFWEPFWVLFDRLGQLNDYCFNQLVASETKLSDLKMEHDRASKDKTECAVIFDYFSEQIPAWGDNVAVFAKAAPIILLASFTEWGLKHIGTRLFGGIPNKTKRGMSDVQFYLCHLVTCGLKVNNTDELLSRVGNFRTIRNKFAHGKWNELEGDIQNLSLRESFAAVSAMFEAIEDAAWRREDAPANK